MKDALLVLAGTGVLLWLLVGCAKPEPEPEGVSTWRRCEAQCPGTPFMLNFSTDPPTCHCVFDGDSGGLGRGGR